jgi:hypothetical protein
VRQPSPRMRPNAVIHTPWTGWTKDAAQARVPTFGAPTAPIPCSVQVDTSEEVDDHRKEQIKTMFNVYFGPGAPAMHVRDKLTWVDGGNLPLTVRSIGQDRAGRGRLGLVRAEHRAP